jgi:pyruvate dehydrogenase E2 component (dihydrolipoamide acetyltransferase)
MAKIELRVPDIGDFNNVPVIEVLVKPGQTVKKNDSLITLESEKASMEIPSSADGTISEINVKVGDTISKGAIIGTLESAAEAPQAAPTPAPVIPSVGSAATGVEGRQPTPSPQPTPAPPQFVIPSAVEGRQPTPAPQPGPPPVIPSAAQSAESRETPQGDGSLAHASPSVRRYARELGVDLQTLSGTGPHGRVTYEDVQGFVKAAISGAGTARVGIGADLPPWPKIDFAQYGPVERKPLSRIKRISGPNLHRNWLQIPHITNYDEADVTGIEKFRLKINDEQEKKKGAKLTMLSFLVKACIAALKEFPEFNASLDGDQVVYKKYYNIGFAADTKDGLVVPVIKNADAKGLLDIAAEASELAKKARDGRLGLAEMSGGTFTISSIGSIGGTSFTQIVNAPEVAILGATRAAMRPVWIKKKFEPRLILPISVSYDHRVVDGAGAARFLVYIANALTDFRRVML